MIARIVSTRFIELGLAAVLLSACSSPEQPRMWQTGAGRYYNGTLYRATQIDPATGHTLTFGCYVGDDGGSDYVLIIEGIEPIGTASAGMLPVFTIDGKSYPAPRFSLMEIDGELVAITVDAVDLDAFASIYAAMKLAGSRIEVTAFNTAASFPVNGAKDAITYAQACG